MLCPINVLNFENMYRNENNVLELIAEAMKDEEHDRAKYKMMMDMTNDEKIRRQIEFAFEDEAVEMYRTIRAMLPTREMRDILYEIITDEQEHATRFVYLYSILK